MYYWNILGIDPTENVSEIKKAYAQKLKLYHPEEDAEGYQKLREAYDSALKYAKRTSSPFLSIDPIPDDNADLNTDLNADLIEENVIQPDGRFFSRTISMQDNLDKSHDQEKQIEELMVNVGTLYDDLFSRIVPSNWEALLNSHVMWNINSRNILKYKMLDFFTDRHHLPQQVWILLDSHFNWSDELDNDSYSPYYNHEILSYIIGQINKVKPLGYSFFKQVEGINYDEYLDARENAQNAYSSENFSDAFMYIQQAKKLYQEDPDLLRLEGILYLRNKDFQKAIDTFNRLLAIDPDDTDGIRYRATAFYEIKQRKRFLEDYNRLYSKKPWHDEILLFMAKNHFKLGNLEKAKYLAIKAQKNNFLRNEARALVSHINAKMRIDINRDLELYPDNLRLKTKLNNIDKEVLKGYYLDFGIVGKGLKVYFVLMFWMFIALLSLGTNIWIVILIYYLIKYLRRISKSNS